MLWRASNPAMLVAGAALLVLSAASAWADPTTDAQATADSGPVATAAHDDTQAKINAWLADSASDYGDDELGGCPAFAPPDRKVHGEVGASIGTGGYRNVYGVVNIPLGKKGDKGDVTLAFSQSRGRGGYGYGYGDYGGPYAYGPGPYAVGEPMLAGRSAWRGRASRCDSRFAANCLADVRDPCALPQR